MVFRALALCLAALFCLPGAAQESAPESTAVVALRESLAADTSISEEERARLSERLNAAARDLDLAAQAEAETLQLRDRLERSAALIADYETRASDIRNAPATIERQLGSNPTLNALEAEIDVVDGQRSEWARQRSEALDASASLAREDGELRRRLGDLQAVDDDNDSVNGEGESAIAARVLQLAIEAQDAARERQRELIELKLRGGADLNSIRTAKISWLDAAIAEADGLLVALREAAAASRESAGAQRSAETRRILALVENPRAELAALAEGNITMIREFRTLGRQIETTRAAVAATRQGIEDVQQDAQLTQRRLEVAGLGAELGDVMLSRLASLPNPASILSLSRQRNEKIASVSTSAIDTEQTMRELNNADLYLASTLADIDDWSTSERRTADQLVAQRRTLLQDNLQAENTLLRLLVDENQAAEELAEVTQDYQALLTGNLLWVRNYNFLRADRLWQRVEEQLSAFLTSDPLSRWPLLLRDVPLLLSIVLLLLALFRYRAVTAALDNMLGVPIRPRDESVALILKGLLLTLIASLPGPLFLAISGRALSILGSGDALASGAGFALLIGALVLLVLSLSRRMVGRLGVGRRLLKWNSPKADLLLSELRWFSSAFVGATMLTVIGVGVSPTDSGGAVGALGSISIAMLLLLVAHSQLKSGLFEGDRTMRYALRIVELLSLAIVVMHLSGQLFAAHLYLRSLVLSIAAVMGVLFIASTLQRFLIIYRLGLERKTREERRARESEGDDENAFEEADAMDAVSSLSEAYTQLLGLLRLLGLGGLLWLIWSPALPALSILDSVILWTTTDPQLPAGDLREVTLAVILLALVVVVTTLLITKHLPPLLNIVLLEWTQVTAGSRYAAGMLLQYLIIGVGFSITLAMLGFQWAKVQWLVAALGVGIGFGLQEIVANFISGLIVLFERPIRVGDIINAGGHDGTVININPRATVIETFEGKELMIPNKELITSTVTNWSLSSTRLRIVVPVGIAYGSDAEDAGARLKRIADAHADVLQDPEPFVTFEDFGDNALVLWLRCYALGDFLRIKTELRQSIYRDFNDAGIGIAFPQRDVHLDANEPIPVRILGDSLMDSQDPHG
ncbi:MAG: mechanosensitive ion channel domain-containing protein [Pseudomonadota bacterium]